MDNKPVEKEIPVVEEVSRNVILNELDLLCKHLGQDLDYNEITINRYAREIADFPNREDYREEEEKAGRHPATLDQIREQYKYYQGRAAGIELAVEYIKKLQRDFCFSNDHKRFQLKR